MGKSRYIHCKWWIVHSYVRLRDGSGFWRLRSSKNGLRILKDPEGVTSVGVEWCWVVWNEGRTSKQTTHSWQYLYIPVSCQPDGAPKSTSGSWGMQTSGVEIQHGPVQTIESLGWTGLKKHVVYVLCWFVEANASRRGYAHMCIACKSYHICLSIVWIHIYISAHLHSKLLVYLCVKQCSTHMRVHSWTVHRFLAAKRTMTWLFSKAPQTKV